MDTRRLGRTGQLSSLVIFGTAAFWEIDQPSANAALDLALAAGINHIDVAPSYGMAQQRLGPWLEPHRDQFYLSCKTLERTRDGAWAELRESLDLLRTDHVDLYQLHAVCTPEDLDAALAPGGAIETLVEAREQGLTKHLGITGHGMLAPVVHAAALERFDFDTVMTPIYPTLYADPDYRKAMEHLLELAQARDVGVMVIKSVARKPWPEDAPHTYNSWYEPFTDDPAIERGVHFALSQPVTAIASPGDVRLLPSVIRAAERFHMLDESEQEAVITAMADTAPIFDPVHTG
jgi:aryl-alcohol dehydrogenase-like predicted oxidoreductase